MVTELSGPELDRVMAKSYRDLTRDEWIALPHEQWVAKVAERKAAEAGCHGHQAEDRGTADEHRRGWHHLRCKHCGMDMSYDSGD